MNQEDNNPLLAEELKKITLKIIERYEIYNYPFAYKIAKSAYQNGIRLKMFKKEYYQYPFQLDEIIYYLIKKELKNTKLIPFINSNLTKKSKESGDFSKSAIIIPLSKQKTKKSPL